MFDVWVSCPDFASGLFRMACLDLPLRVDREFPMAVLGPIVGAMKLDMRGA